MNNDSVQAASPIDNFVCKVTAVQKNGTHIHLMFPETTISFNWIQDMLTAAAYHCPEVGSWKQPNCYWIDDEGDHIALITRNDAIAMERYSQKKGVIPHVYVQSNSRAPQPPPKSKIR